MSSQEFGSPVLRHAVILSPVSASLFAWACASSPPAASIPASAYEQPSRAPAAARSQYGWAILDEVSRAAGIPILSSVVLRPEVRELRLSASVSGMIWQPIPLLRLFQWPDSATGELYLYWPRLRDSTGREVSPGWVRESRNGCRSVHQTNKWATCRISPEPGTSWQAIADSLHALDIWGLPPGHVEERRGSRSSDQDGVLAELLIGAAYRRFRYYDLDKLTGDDVFRVRAAAQLVAALVPS
jgi:hypothetical protein